MLTCPFQIARVVDKRRSEPARVLPAAMKDRMKPAGRRLVSAALWDVNIPGSCHAGRAQASRLIEGTKLSFELTVVARVQSTIYPLENLSSAVIAAVADIGRLAANLARGIARRVKVCGKRVPGARSGDEGDAGRVAEMRQLLSKFAHRIQSDGWISSAYLKIDLAVLQVFKRVDLITAPELHVRDGRVNRWHGICNAVGYLFAKRILVVSPSKSLKKKQRAGHRTYILITGAIKRTGCEDTEASLECPGVRHTKLTGHEAARG